MTLEVFRDPDDATLAHPLLVRLGRYWRSCRDGDRLPARVAIDPAAIVPVLPHVILIDVHGAGQYRYRLVGTSVADRFGHDVTGEPVDKSWLGPDWPAVRRDFDYVVQQRRPCMTRGTMRLSGEIAPVAYRRLLLPLASDGETVDVLIGAIIFEG
ncbi:MAG: PAS domain-containing protein [Pseudomonadota bacterium]|nr:PAS domain-containing protein [Pseudomonadota bacterium]